MGQNLATMQRVMNSYQYTVTVTIAMKQRVYVDNL